MAARDQLMTREQFGRLVKYACIIGAVLLPAVTAIVLTHSLILTPNAQQAQQTFDTIKATQTEAKVSTVRGLCGQGASDCSAIGLEIALPGGERTVIKWAPGKTYGESVPVWQKGNGNWTAKEPRLDDGDQWAGVFIVAIGAIVTSMALLAGVTLVRERTWRAIAPAFLPQRRENQQGSYDPVVNWC